MIIAEIHQRRDHYTVMAGLVPAIHVFLCSQDVDARDKRRQARA
jgi:hypothetical protein